MVHTTVALPDAGFDADTFVITGGLKDTTAVRATFATGFTSL